MFRSYKYKIKLSQAKLDKINNILELQRNLYNACLEQKICAYRTQGIYITRFDQQKEITQMKKEMPEYKAINAQSLQMICKRVDDAFQLFFKSVKLKNRVGFPRFKSISRYRSFIYTQSGWRINKGYLIVAGVGSVKLMGFKKKNPSGVIKNLIFKKDACGEWFVTFVCCVNKTNRLWCHEKSSVGLDLGVKHFIFDSDGNIIDNPNILKKRENNLKKKQRKFERSCRYSKNRTKKRINVAKSIRKITRIKEDFQWKTARKYVEKYKSIFIEDLDIESILKSSKKGRKNILDVSWGLFVRKLFIKAEETGCTIKKVKSAYTTQKCSGCGNIVKKNLDQRIHSCSCGIKIDRDYNAALNILKAGLGEALCGNVIQ